MRIQLSISIAWTYAPHEYTYDAFVVAPLKYDMVVGEGEMHAHAVRFATLQHATIAPGAGLAHTHALAGHAW